MGPPNSFAPAATGCWRWRPPDWQASWGTAAWPTWSCSGQSRPSSRCPTKPGWMLCASASPSVSASPICRPSPPAGRRLRVEAEGAHRPPPATGRPCDEARSVCAHRRPVCDPAAAEELSMDEMSGKQLIYDWNVKGEAPHYPARVLITDETLRDGLQSPSIIHGTTQRSQEA